MIEQIISSIHPTPTFFLGLIPMPVILILNIMVFLKLHQVRRLSHHHKLKMPEIYRRGIIVNAISFAVFLTPAITEMRIFVTNPKWFYFYMLSGALAIVGQIMVIRGLNTEIVAILSRRRRKSGRKAGKTSTKAPLKSKVRLT